MVDHGVLAAHIRILSFIIFIIAYCGKICQNIKWILDFVEATKVSLSRKIASIWLQTELLSIKLLDKFRGLDLLCVDYLIVQLFFLLWIVKMLNIDIMLTIVIAFVIQ